MNKIKLIIVVFSFVIVFCFVGAFFVQADIEILEEEDVLKTQNDITFDIKSYGYTLDNPNVIVDPYGENYNVALIMFETDEYISFNVIVNGEYSFYTDKTNRHYIGVYNLVEGKNIIEISSGKYSKIIEIDVIDKNFLFNFEDNILLSNNHFLIPTYNYLDEGVYTGIREVDILGKIYYEYLLEDGYSGIACEIDEERLAVLSNSLIILDRQNGSIIDKIDISNYDEQWISVGYLDNKIVLFGSERNVAILEDGSIEYIDYNYNKKVFSGNVNYKNVEGIRFYNKTITELSDDNLWLLSYKKISDNDIDIKKEFNRIVISSNKINNCNSYLILDKLFDKRVYKLCNNYNYIYTYDLSGKYSVYFKIDDKIYKTNKFFKY